MIKDKDLRVGNLVLYKPYGNQDGEMKTIQGMLGMKAYFDRHSNESGMFHNLQGIPLTEEWLKKCGFEKVSGREGWEWKKGYFTIGEASYFFIEAAGQSFKITTVHQLMNIFHSLTGQELTIQP